MIVTRRSFKVTLPFVSLLLFLTCLFLVQSAPQVHATSNILRVTTTGATSGACGQTWANPCSLQYALTTIALEGDEIWVAAGKYTPGSVVSASFQLKNGVSVYGGFAATETVRNQRNFTTNLTILSGDADGNDVTDPYGVVITTNNITGSNAYHVVMGTNLSTTTVLDGFTITGGNANGPSTLGGGLYLNIGSPALANLTFVSNIASKGGGMYNASSHPHLTNIIFRGNLATLNGGGLDNENSNPVLLNVVFSGNRANWASGLYNYNSSPTLTNVTFLTNTASASIGGGMVNESASNPSLTNVTFNGNSAVYQGGGMVNRYSRPTLINVTFNNNSAERGGGIYNDNQSIPTLTNVTFNGNSAVYQGGGIYNTDYSIPKIRNTILWGNTAPIGAQVFNSSSTPVISNSVMQGGCPASSQCTNIITATPRLGVLGDYGGGMLTLPLLPGSSAIDATTTNCPVTDQRGVVRSVPACDIGAFEVRGFALTKTGGDHQAAVFNTAFVQPLSVTLHEIDGPALAGVTVTFTTPFTGASALLSNPIVTTEHNGQASVTATANSLLGSYPVTATASGLLTPAVFSLTNIKIYPVYLPLVVR